MYGRKNISRRYEKKLDSLWALNEAMLGDKEELLARARRRTELYIAQPRRLHCKICETSLPENPDFLKQGAPYAFCPECGHVNGLHEDTEAFHAAIQSDQSPCAVSDAETGDLLMERLRTIYLPKAEYLRNTLRAAGETPAALAYTDLGAGNGCFVAALMRAGIDNCRGYETSPTRVALANHLLPAGQVTHCSRNELLELARRTESDVVSMIGALEQLQDPRNMLTALRDNANIRYLYLAVPLFSPCLFIELAYPGVFPRQLAGDHTHLFTAASLAHMQKEFGLEQMVEWCFGADMMDFFRSLSIALDSDEESIWSRAARGAKTMGDAFDPTRLAMDRNQLSSVVHAVYRFVR